MGRKNKNKNTDESSNNKNASQQTQNPQSEQRQQQGAGSGGQSQQQQRPQQGAGSGGQSQQQQRPQQGALGVGQSQQQQRPKGAERGGQSQQQHRPQQGARDEGQSQQQQRPKGAESGEQSQQQQRSQQGAGGGGQSQQQQRPQQGAWGGGQSQQQQRPQQGAWGGGQSQQQQRPQQGALGGGQSQQQRSHQGAASGGQSQQQQRPQQGAWGGGQSQQQQRSQQGAGGGGQYQQQQRPQQGAWGGGQSQQQQRPQQGALGGGQSQQQRSHQGAAGGGQSQQQQRPQGGSDQQRRGGDHHQRQQHNPGQQSGGQFQGGRGQQQKPQQGGYSQDQRGERGHSGALRQEMENLSISDEKPLPVKETSCNGIRRGTLGQPGVVEVNYVKLNLDKMPKEAYHYDVSITPDRPKKFLRPAFEQCRIDMFPNALLSFDGMKSCYSIERLKTPIDHKVEIPDSGNRMKEFQVQIKETDNCIVDLQTLRTYQNEKVSDKPMRALQVLEVVLASNNHERGVRVGRSFFRRPHDAFDLEDGYEAWTGLYQAAILGEIPLLNVDIAHKSFPCESTLIKYLENQDVDIRQDITTTYKYRDIKDFLKGINIIYTPPQHFGAPPKQYKVLDLGEPASRKTFKNDEGVELTVARYFQSRNCILNYPNLPCIQVGSAVRQISLPMELCSIPSGQALNRKDGARQVEKMIRYAATSTNRRKEKIMDLLRYFCHNQNQIIRAFGLQIGSSFIKVPMRLLTSPRLEYLQGQTVTTFKGAWRMDRNKFLICSKPPNGHKWAILYEDSKNRRGISHHDLENFKNSVIRTSQSLNMNMQSTADIRCYNFRELQSMLKKMSSEKYDLVFVVLSDRGTPYAKIKQVAELEVGILTQCIKDKTVFRTIKDITVFSNIMLKVNGKLNGTNHKIAQDRDSNLLSPIKNVMYLGADVTHPSPDQKHIPSVVGVAASHDLHGACYNCQYRLQPSAVENIEDMESIVSQHLKVYYEYQKSYPSLILYYRDGVSDGQFPIVEREEIRAIKRACSKKGCNPKITCVIVVKRHHTRFFPLSKPQHDRDFNNVQAGTVVDQHITHPNEVQFFMVSHQSIQGTARPTRYNVIMDESNFDINLLQKLTYNLCHLFPRCNRAVSYPAPAYLAHLVAFRGRVYLEGTQRFDNLKREYERRQIRPEFMIRNPMYFI